MRDRGFIAVTAVVFAASAAATVWVCRSMRGAMPMPGGWTMSMAWMRMPGQSWSAAGGMFLAMWLTMMLAMMMPAAALTLSKYRIALLIRGRTRIGWLTLVAAAGYFSVWLAIGVIVYPIGAGLASIAMRSPGAARAVPMAGASVVFLGGLFQLTPWKARQLRGCRDSSDCCEHPAITLAAAWLQGARSGLRCISCCVGYTASLLMAGVMNLAAMAVVTAAITVERAAPRPVIVARVIGVVLALIGIASGIDGVTALMRVP